MIDKIPPQNLEAERAVLGAMLLNKEAVIEAIEKLTAADFYRDTHRIIFEAMCDLHRKNLPIDLITLNDQLKKMEMMEKAGGIGFVSQLANEMPTAAHIAHHAQIVKEKAQLRALINAAMEIEGTAYSEADDVAEIMDMAEKRVLEVASRDNTSNFTHIKEIVLDAFSQIESRAANKGSLTGIPSGFIDLDRLTAGFQPSDLVLVAARPSMGKTAFTLNIAANVAIKEKKPVAFFSLEMSKEQLVQRLLSAEGGVDSQRLRRGDIEGEWKKLIYAADKLSEAPLYIDDTPGISVLELRSKARRLKAERGLSIIIIDYLQLMRGHSSHGGDNRHQEISEISRSLKALARELKVPVIALSQLSRGVEARQSKRPMLSDLRESGSLEQDADIVMFLYREDYYEKETENKNITEVIVAKHRNGPVDNISLFFQKEFTKFVSLSKEI